MLSIILSKSRRSRIINNRLLVSQKPTDISNNFHKLTRRGIQQKVVGHTNQFFNSRFVSHLEKERKKRKRKRERERESEPKRNWSYNTKQPPLNTSLPQKLEVGTFMTILYGILIQLKRQVGTNEFTPLKKNLGIFLDVFFILRLKRCFIII